MFKWMTRICSICMMALLLWFTPTYAHAEVWEFNLFREKHELDTRQSGFFEITGGLTNDVEFTFDTVRILVGQATGGTEIRIEIFEYTEDGFFWRIFEDSLTVGASGVFSRSFDLALGQNFILITAEEKDSEERFDMEAWEVWGEWNEEDKTVFVFTALVVRKDMEIQQELVQGIVLPGEIPSDWRTQR